MDYTRLIPRVKAFLSANGLVVAVAVFEHQSFGLLLQREETMGPAAYLLGLYLVTLVRIVVLLKFVESSTSTKEKINRSRKDNQGSLKEILVSFLCFTVPMEALEIWSSLSLFNNFSSGINVTSSYIGFFLIFIVKSFAFEMIFDFMHYWVHRTYHEHKYLYKMIHQRHHSCIHPSPLSTYVMSPSDMFLSNYVPFLASVYLFPFALSSFELHLLVSYKTFVEIAGHAGIETNSTSFPQAVVLPKLLGIQMRTNDHDLHHTAIGRSCNFGKRFTLWDKVFGTYMNPASMTKRKLFSEYGFAVM